MSDIYSFFQVMKWLNLTPDQCADLAPIWRNAAVQCMNVEARAEKIRADRERQRHK